VHLKDGKVTRIEGNKGHGLTLGNARGSVTPQGGSIIPTS
jgi:hypothetical protein